MRIPIFCLLFERLSSSVSDTASRIRNALLWWPDLLHRFATMCDEVTSGGNSFAIAVRNNSIPDAGESPVVVYDTLGREVRTLVSGQVGAGSHHVRFSADGLPGGTFFCRHEFGGSSLTRRMVFLK